MQKESLTKKIVRLAIFLALGVVLNIVESLIPLPIAIPGIRLGLANTMGLLVLYYYSPKEYVALGLLRVFIVGLLRTGIGSVAFFISLGGNILASAFTILIYLFKKSSIYGLSITSAMFHQVGQILVVIIYYQLVAMINYLPILLVSGAISGGLIAGVTSAIIVLLNKSFGIKDTNQNPNANKENDSVISK